MNIQKIIFSNFKLFKEKTIELGSNNVLTGRNKVGKTTVFNAIEFTLFGTVDGSSGTDRWIHHGEDNMSVTLFTDMGVFFRKKTLSGSTTLKLNEMPTNQETLNSSIGVTYKEFLSSSLAGYFMSLDNASKRAILLKITAPVDKRAIFDRLVKDNTIADDLHINFDDLASTAKQIKAQYKVLETSQNMHLSNRKLLNEQIVEAENELRELKYIDIKELDIQIDVLAQRRAAEDTRLANANASKVNVQIALERLRPQIVSLVPENGTVAAIKKQITAKKKELKALPNPTCKECGQVIQENASESLNISVDITVLEENIQDIEENKVKASENKKVQKEIDKLEAQLKDFKEEDKTVLQKLTSDWTDVYDKIRQAEASNSKYHAVNANVESLKAKLMIEMKSSIENDLFKYEAANNALKPSGLLVEELKLKKTELEAKTNNRYSFEFLKPNKSGEGFQEVVEVYEGKTEFNQMCGGEKIRWNVNIARIIGKYYGIKLLFLDESTRLDFDVKPIKDEQLITAYVDRDKTELSINV